MKDHKETLDEFKQLVNMSKSELEEWLETPDSQHTGLTEAGQDEAIGHKSGRRIVELLDKSDDQYDDDDYQHMSKVVSYVKRHSAQRHRMGEKAQEDLEHTKWTASLRNWGHDPLKDSA